MAKKSRNDRWVRGWATRRAKMEAKNKLPMCSENGVLGHPLIDGSLNAAPVMQARVLTSQRAMDVAIQSPSIVDLIMAGARKRNGRAEVDALISEHLHNRNTEYQRQSAHAADLFQRAALKSHRDEVICGLIAEFEAARGLGSANVWKISHRFWAHVVNALKDAGYSAHGRANSDLGYGKQEPRG